MELLVWHAMGKVVLSVVSGPDSSAGLGVMPDSVGEGEKETAQESARLTFVSCRPPSAGVKG